MESVRSDSLRWQLVADFGQPGWAADDQHLDEMTSRLPAPAMADATFVLTGKASSIQHWRRALGALRVPAARIITNAYWAPGKTGLD